MNFQHVTCHEKGWCEWHLLDGYKLMDGEQVLVRFENGTQERHQIKVKLGSHKVNDMFNVVDIPESKAYIDIVYNGTVFEVPLYDKGGEAPTVKFLNDPQGEKVV